MVRPEPTPQEIQTVAEIVARIQEIHQRYTTDAIAERLTRSGYSDLEAAVRAETVTMRAEYEQLDVDYAPGLAELAFRHVEGLERVPHICGAEGDGQHRRPIAKRK